MDSATPEQPRRRAYRAAVTAVVTLLVVLGIGEAGARYRLGDASLPRDRDFTPQMRCGMHDAELGWRLRPGARTRIGAFGDADAYEIAINEQGLRDEAHPYAKPPGVTRILLLGDSVAWGWGVPVDVSFAHHLERLLGPDVEVVNGAVPGWSTDQEQWWLESEGHLYEPDLVLATFIVNDLPGNASVHMHGLDKPRWTRTRDREWVVEGRPVPDVPARFVPPPGDLWKKLMHHSALLRLAWTARRPDVPAMDLDRKVREPGRPKATPDEITVHAFRRMKKTCDEIGAPLAAVYIPHLQDMGLLSPDHRPPPDSGGPILTDLSRFLDQVGRQTGFRSLSIDRDLLVAVQRGEMLMIRPDGHLSERGHEVVAEALAQRLRPMLEASRRR